MYPGTIFVFCRYIVNSVLACVVGDVRSLSFPISAFLSLCLCDLSPHRERTECDEILSDVGRQLHPIVSQRIAVLVYNIFDVITISDMLHFVIHGVLLRHIRETLLFCSCVTCLHLFSVSVHLVGCVVLSSIGVSFVFQAIVSWSTDSVLHFTSPSTSLFLASL